MLHLNYLHHAPLADWLKKIGVEFYLLVTIHYLDWCFMLKGNTRLFRSIIHKEEQSNEARKYGIVMSETNDCFSIRIK